VDDCIQQTQLAVPLEDTPNDAPGYVCAHEQISMTAGEDGLNVKIAGRLPGRAIAAKEVRGLS
jgi:hypothetical protein